METDGLRSGALPRKYDGEPSGDVLEYQTQTSVLTQGEKNSVGSSITQGRGIVSGFLRHSGVTVDTNILQCTSKCLEKHKISNEIMLTLIRWLSG